MNLSELKAKTIQQIGENPSDPQFWPVDEIVDNINEAYREVVRLSGLKDFCLPLLEAERGAFFFPHDLLRAPKKVYWQGRPLPQKSIEYLEAEFTGTSHDRGMVGNGRSFAGNFRAQTGEPVCWYVEDGKIKLFPTPAASSVPSTVRETVYSTLAAGSLTLTLPSDIPTSQANVDLWLDGVYQHPDQWTIVSARRIDFLGSALGVAVTACVRFMPASLSASIVASTRRHMIPLAAGATRINVPGGYVQGVGSLSIYIDGIAQAPSSCIESSPAYVTLVTPVAMSATALVAVTHPDPFGVAAALYSARPQALALDTDTPDLMEDIHRAIWQYAAYLCMIRDGRGQDMNKAGVFQALFEKTMRDFDFSPDITVSPAVSLPFRM